MFELSPGEVLVSGDAGLIVCSTSGKKGQSLPSPANVDFMSAVTTTGGTIWVTAFDQINRMHIIYQLELTTGRMFLNLKHTISRTPEDRLFLGVSKNKGLWLLALRNNQARLMELDYESTFAVKQTVSLSGVNSWKMISKMAMSKSGPVVSHILSHCVHAFTMSGQLRFTLGVCGKNGNTEGMLYLPSGVSVDDRDNIYVAENGNNRISVFSPAGQYLGHAGSVHLKKPMAVFVTSDNKLVVGQAGSVLIFRLNT